MSTQRATRMVLERLAAGAGVLLVLLLDLGGARPAWADGVDAEGRAVLLVGRHQLGQGESAQALVAQVLAMLARGEVPADVHVVAYARKASEALAEIVGGTAREVLVDGPRGTGKTQMTPGALAGLAELHARAGLPLPLKVLWVHDSLKSAGAKTARSLAQPHWVGLWSLRDDSTVAVLAIGGVDHVVADFVASTDPTAAERLKAECHAVIAEEVVPSLSESSGVDEDKYELALTSARLKPNRRRVGVVVTNPGGPDSWPAIRFGLEGALPHAGCVRRQIPASDRMSAHEQAEQIEGFRNSPEQQLRLGRGEWVDLKLGEAVTPSFADLHIAPERLRPRQNVTLVFGHDGGHTPVTIVGARYAGTVEVYAALSSEHAGTRQHLSNLVIPWLAAHAPWALKARSLMRHFYDPSMATGEQADIDQDPVRVLRELLGGAYYPGAIDWPARIEPVSALFALFNGHTGRPVLQIDPEDGKPLIRALRGRWHFPTINGRISRDLPKKPNHPHEDLGDGFCYFVGGIAPSRAERPTAGPQQYAVTGARDPWGTASRERQYATSRTAMRG